MTEVILVRHGQTEWNRQERFRGRMDLPLNETGLHQAQAVARRVAGWPISAFYTSPLQRSLHTAKVIAQAFGREPKSLPGLIDIDYGEWQGLSPQEVAERYPELYATWLSRPHLVTLPGGESLEIVQGRAFSALLQLCQEHPQETILVVGHQVVNRVLLSAALGLEVSAFWRIRQDTGCINRLRYDGRSFEMLLLNDTCHLAGL